MTNQDPNISRWVEEISSRISVHPVPLASLDQETLAHLLRTLSSQHRLDGAASQRYPAILVFRQPPHATDLNRLRLFFWSYPGTFGNGLDVTAYFPNAGKSRVLVSGEREFLDTLVCGRFYAVVADGLSASCAFEVDTTGFSSPSEFLRAIRKNLSVDIDLDDLQAYCWEVLWRTERVWRPHLSVTDHLSLGWVTSYRQTVGDFVKAVEALQSADNLLSNSTEELEPILRAFFEHVKTTPREMAGLVRDVDLEVRRGRFWELISALVRLSTSDVEWQPFCRVLGCAIRAHFESSRLTECGCTIPWVDSSGRLQSIRLQPERFRDPAKAARTYWASLQVGCGLLSFTMPLGHLIDPHDVPVSPGQEGTGWGQFQGAENVDEATAATEALLAEAVSCKSWTIPPRALVDLEIGPYSYVELTECEPDVFFTLRTARDEFRIVSVNPAAGSWNAAFTVLDENQESSEQKVRVEAGVRLLLAALVRDFWVVEERESVFGYRLDSRRRGPRMAQEDDEPRVVYLPKIRYRTVVPDVRRCNESLRLGERRIHWVSAHLRRAGTASPQQQALAIHYGFHIPRGYTFVRPHERGRLRRDVVYRSRSALQSLYIVETRSAETKSRPKWFQFERDVTTLMRSLGFSVEHVTSSRTGHRGIDVFATKGEDLDRICWIVECKCWSPWRKVRPNVVRELAGTLRRYPEGTRGMIVTTSTFTLGAVEEARRLEIRIMDGIEFSQLVGRADRVSAQPPS